MAKLITYAMIIVAALAWGPFKNYALIETVEAVVTDKDRVTERSGDSASSRYLIFTKSETFENSDSLWHWKWDSSDLYGSMQERELYRLTVTGLRVPFLSMYRNVVEAVPLSAQENRPQSDMPLAIH